MYVCWGVETECGNNTWLSSGSSLQFLCSQVSALKLEGPVTVDVETLNVDWLCQSSPDLFFFLATCSRLLDETCTRFFGASCKARSSRQECKRSGRVWWHGTCKAEES